MRFFQELVVKTLFVQDVWRNLYLHEVEQIRFALKGKLSAQKE